MQTVAELDEYNTYITVHSEKHFSDVLDMCLFLVGKLYLNDFCKTVDEHCHVAAKHLGKDIKVSLIGAILYGIVQECRTNRVSVKTELSNYFSNCYRMAYVGLSTESVLTRVELLSV